MIHVGVQGDVLRIPFMTCRHSQVKFFPSLISSPGLVNGSRLGCMHVFGDGNNNGV